MSSSSSAGMGGGSPLFVANPQEIAAAGNSLVSHGDAIRAARGYGPIEGVGEADAVEAAAASFRETWGTALTTWQTDVASFGNAVSAAGATIAQTDANLAAAWSAQNGGAQ